MKTDLYLKIVLTVIAISLTVLVFQNSNIKLTQTANANATNIQSTHPQNDRTTGVMNVNIVSVNGTRISAIPVTVTNTPNVKVETGYGGLEVYVTNTPNVKLDTRYGGLDVNVTNYRDFK